MLTLVHLKFHLLITADLIVALIRAAIDGVVSGLVEVDQQPKQSETRNH